MLQVQHLSFQLVFHHIHQGQLISQLLHSNRRQNSQGHSGSESIWGRLGVKQEYSLVNLRALSTHSITTHIE